MDEVERGRCAATLSRPWTPILRAGLDVVFVGFNPSPLAAALGHYYANPRNRFWDSVAPASKVLI